MQVIVDTTSFSMNVQLFDDTNGSPKTGLVYNSAGVNISYARAGAARVAVTEVTLASASAAYASGGFVEIDATNMPGVYRFDIPDAAIATGVQLVTITFLFTGVRSKAVNIGLRAIIPTAVEIRTEIDSNSTKLITLLEKVGFKR